VANHPFFADAVIIASLAAVNTFIGANGKLEIYAGAQPTDANTAITTQTLLSTLTFGSTAFGTPVASGSAGSKVVTATANTIASDTSAANTGTAAWFRCFKSDGTTVVMDGSVDTSGADLNLNTTSIVAGATVSCTSFTITQLE
jgi:hypothetical protein